jgi:transposase-like protein
MTTRRSFSDKSKATVALEALRGDKTAQEIAAKHKIHLLPAGVCRANTERQLR